MGCFATSDTKPKESATYGFAKQEDLQDAIRYTTHNTLGDENLSMQIELHLACTNLKNMDVVSLTDSVCVVYLKEKQ